MSCGLHGNVFRLLPPLTASDEELERGFDLLEKALAQATDGESCVLASEA